MQIQINKTTEHNDYFTFTDDESQEYKWHKRAGVDISLRNILLGIRVKEYPGCPSFGDLESMEQWIADGHKIIIGYDEEEQPIYEVIEKVPWTSTHPDIFPATGAEAINLKAAAKDLVENLTYDDIDDHIDNVFSNLNTDQKNSLKKLYKVVLFLAKR